MKTLLLLSRAYLPSIGGVENSLFHLAREAMGRGWRVVIVVSDAGCNGSDNRGSQEVDNGIEVFRYPERPISWLGGFNLPFSVIGNLRLLRTLNVERETTLLVARFHLSVLVARIAGYKDVNYLVPSVVNQLYRAERKGNRTANAILMPLKTRFHSFLQRAACQLSNVYAFSENVRADITKYLGIPVGDIRLTKPGVDESRFYPPSSISEKRQLRSLLGLPEDQNLVLFVGRMAGSKGLDVLVETLLFMSEDVSLVFVGEGDMKQSLITQAKKYGVDQRCIWLPATTNVEDYYRCCDVFAMSSGNEALGQTILEALASGLPVAAFSRGSGVETATEELGFNDYIAFANEYTAECLSRAIVQQLSVDDSTRIKQSERAHTMFSWSQLLDDVLAA